MLEQTIQETYTIQQQSNPIATIEPRAYAYGGAVLAGTLILATTGVIVYNKILRPIGRFFREVDERVFGPREDIDKE